MNADAKNANERFHCLRCGRKHNKSSEVGAFHHYELDVTRENFEPDTAAIGIAFVQAYKDKNRDQPSATITEIESKFKELGFAEQFPELNVGSKIEDWEKQGLIGDVRHSGKHWFTFLANRGTARDADRSPASFHAWMKNFASEFKRAKKR